ncbi:MAG TPA: tetratricopeptide repeat protein [Bryobacteraceae bacterium]|nr:tetratricopeptide repeat protein [Bryobacteraceae bacterium]
MRGCFLLAGLASLALLCLGAPSEPPTFARDIAPIIYQNCVTCHHPGGVGPFPLLTYQEVKKHGAQIAAVTASRYMPPWKAQAGYGEFQDERRLSDEQIRSIAKWVQAGAPEGADVPPAPKFTDGWQLGKPDVVLEASHAFTVPASGPDVFWNFIFKPDLKSTRYVRALEIRPNGSAGARNVHHANLIIDRMGSLIRAKADLADGFAGMDLRISENPFDPASHLLFWKAGTIPKPEPDGMAWRLDPGNILILNTHLQPSGKLESVRPQIGLYFTDQAPTRFPLIVELENDDALDIPPRASRFPVADDLRMPEDVDVLAIYPHAHYLGKLLEAYATLPDGTRKWLIRIPDWDPNWQAVYRFQQPVFLPKGSIISMRYVYDNSAGNPRNPNHPPERVTAGNQATDEMSHLWLQILPRGTGDRRRPLQEAVARHRLDKHPDDSAANLNLGAVLMSRLDMQGAVTALNKAVALDPKRPEAHDMLGSSLQSLGFTGEALQQFRLALAADPDYINARYDLAKGLAHERKFDQAAAEFQRVAQAFPQNARIQDEYGVLLAQCGRTSEAAKQFELALQIDPGYDDARKNRDELAKTAGGAKPR